jgi:hypothetical protein
MLSTIIRIRTFWDNRRVHNLATTSSSSSPQQELQI